MHWSIAFKTSLSGKFLLSYLLMVLVGVATFLVVAFALAPTLFHAQLVRVGTTVTWTNQDRVPHSVTFQNGMVDSGLLARGESFSYTFSTPGTYQYSCSVHPSMVATVIVVS